ncbi:MAG: hypothetical protein KDA33_01685 [Phycisphaerales bacterium]|nr:hypothetical protein [Phycisphaerales bacterium]
MNLKRLPRISFVMVCIAVAPATLADVYTLSRYTVDGGGGRSAGAGFELTGSVGQHDAGPAAGPMSGAGFEIRGGFWAASESCSCPGDMNGDGARNGADIQQFVSCLIMDNGCSCADVDSMAGVTMDDVVVFVDDLLAGAGCN